MGFKASLCPRSFVIDFVIVINIVKLGRTRFLAVPQIEISQWDAIRLGIHLQFVLFGIADIGRALSLPFNWIWGVGMVRIWGIAAILLWNFSPISKNLFLNWGIMLMVNGEINLEDLIQWIKLPKISSKRRWRFSFTVYFFLGNFHSGRWKADFLRHDLRVGIVEARLVLFGHLLNGLAKLGLLFLNFVWVHLSSTRVSSCDSRASLLPLATIHKVSTYQY